MELREYGHVLRREWVLVLLPMVAALLLAPALARTGDATYTSRAVLYASPTADPNAGAEVAAQRLAAYVELAGSRRVAAAVAQQLRPAASVAEVQETVTATADPASLLLSIEAVSSPPERAQQLAAATAEQLVLLSRTLEPGGEDSTGAPLLVLAEEAQAATERATGTAADAVLAGALGLFLGCVLALLREAVAAPLRSERDVERSAGGLRSLGTAGLDGRSGIRLHAAVRASRTPPPTVLLVTGVGSGRGAAGVAGALSLAHARTHRNAVLVCLGPDCGDLLASWGIAEGVGLAEVLTGRSTLRDALCPHPQGGLEVLRRGDLRDDAQDLAAGEPFSELVGTLAKTFDFVVVAAPPVTAQGDLPLLPGCAASGVVLVAPAGPTGGHAVRRSVSQLQVAGVDVLGFVLVVASDRSHPQPPVDKPSVRSPGDSRAYRPMHTRRPAGADRGPD